MLILSAVALAGPLVHPETGEALACERDPVDEEVGRIDGGAVRYRGCLTGCCLTGVPMSESWVEWESPRGPVTHMVTSGLGPDPAHVSVAVWGRSIQVAGLEAPGRPYHEIGPLCAEILPSTSGLELLSTPCFSAYTRHLDEAMWALALGELEVARPLIAETDPTGGWGDATDLHRGVWLRAGRDIAVARLQVDPIGAALVARAVLDLPAGDLVPEGGADVDLVNDLAWVMEQGGLASEAIPFLEAVVSAAPSRAVAWLNLGDAAWKAGDGRRAGKAYATYRRLRESDGGAVVARAARRLEGEIPPKAEPPVLPSVDTLIAGGDLAAARGHLLLDAATEESAARFSEALAGASLRSPRPFRGPLVPAWPHAADLPSQTFLHGEAARRVFGLPPTDGYWIVEIFDGRIDDDLRLDRLLVGRSSEGVAFALFRGAAPGAPPARLVVPGARDLDWTVDTDWVSLGSDDGTFPRRIAVRWLDADGDPVHAALEPR